MKGPTTSAHSPVVVSTIADASRTVEQTSALEPAIVYAEHGDFVWSRLHRLGVRDADLEDMLQEVFIVVHKRRGSFDGSARITTWLFGICLRVAAAYRRRAYQRLETTGSSIIDDCPDTEGAGPEAALVARRARARLDAILDGMPLEKRAVFVMFEIEGLPCDQIATLMGVPVGTVYSRLHAARKAFEAGMGRWKARDAREEVVDE